MTRKRAPDFDVRQAVHEDGFTPRAGDAGALLDLLAEGGDDAAAAERALLRLGEGAVAPAIARAGAADPAARAGALRALGRMRGEAVGAALLAALGDGDERVRRAAAGALGRARPERAAEALVTALGREPGASARRAMIEALGKVGGEAAIAALAGAGEDPATARERGRAALMATRTQARAEASTLIADRAPEAPLRFALRCRAGLEDILLGELPRALRPRLAHEGPGGVRVEGTLAEAPATLFRARTFLSLGFPLPEVKSDDPAEAVVSALTSPAAVALLRRFTEGPLRFRLSFQGGGKRRAAVWQVAAAVAARAPELINDPTESPWEAQVFEAPGVVRVELCPALEDPRFAYRRGDVPAASHPTLAAALVRVAGASPDDVVWDPFVGSGTELCERALAGPYRMLIGTDLEPRALQVARANLEAAGVKDALLLQGDAATRTPPGPPPTRIVTNPPLGRRVQRASALGPLLDRFLVHASYVLAPGGRLVWMSPFPRRTREMAEARGLSLVEAREVDMGGFSAEMQVLAKRG